MADEVNINELDASDLSDILTEINGKATKVKNVAAARKDLTAALESKGLVLSTDDEGNFVLNPKKTKAKAKAAPEPEPEEDEEEAEDEESDEDEDEDEDEESDEDEEEAEEEEEEEAPPPPKKGKAKAAPEPAPKAKAKTKTKAKAEDEDEEVKAPKTKRAPPPREPKIKDDQKITIVKSDAKFAEGSGRAAKWAILKKCKTVGEFIKKATEAELASPRGYLSVCVKAGHIKIA